MKSAKLRKKFLEFFKKRKHKIIPSSSLLPADPTVLFTTAGMQQFKEYYLGKPSPYGNKVCSVQKCFRTSDIEAVGDSSHLTFLEMLGNFSFNNAYFKKEAIEWALELLNSKFKIPTSKIWITVFKGNKNIPKDKETQQIWEGLGIAKEKIHSFGREDNFWGPTGKEGPCGPTTEIHYDLTGRPCKKGKRCIPNCECGRFIELWNLVFNEYYQSADKKLSLLQQKGVDTGMGLERLAMVVQGKTSVFETDLFVPITKKIRNTKSEMRNKFQIPNSKFQKSERIIADHIKGAVFLIAEGILPSNIERGYALRRILRRAIRYGKILNLAENFLIPLAQEVIKIYKDIYLQLKQKETDVLTVIQKEGEKFEQTLDKGLKFLQKNIEAFRRFDEAALKERSQKLPFKGGFAFYMYETYGFPPDLTLEELKKYPEVSQRLNEKEYWAHFQKRLKEHQEISRAGAERKFGGIGIDKLEIKSEKLKVIRLHTATHLLHQALREVLGSQVKQMGSDITPERLRFDFSHSAKMTPEELKKVEDLVNQKIKEDLEVRKEEMSYQDALKSGALAFFKEKYPERVSVYSIGFENQVFSKEICAGPHINKTSEIGHFKIIKEEGSGAGVRRIRAILE